MDKEKTMNDNFIKIIVNNGKHVNSTFFPKSDNFPDGIGFELSRTEKTDVGTSWFVSAYCFDNEKFNFKTAKTILAKLGMGENKNTNSKIIKDNVLLYSAHPRVGRIEGIAISPGEWTGIDGHTINYTPEKLIEHGNSIIGARIKMQPDGEDPHTNTSASVVGWVDGWKASPSGDVSFSAAIFDKPAFKKLKDRHYKALVGEIKPYGVSIEAETLINDTGDDTYQAEKINISDVEILDNPACKTSKITHVEDIRLTDEDPNINNKDKDKQDKPDATPLEVKVDMSETIAAQTKLAVALAEQEKKLAEVIALTEERTKQLDAKLAALDAADKKAMQDRYDAQYAETVHLSEYEKKEVDGIISTVEDSNVEGKLKMLETALSLMKKLKELKLRDEIIVGGISQATIKNADGTESTMLEAAMKVAAEDDWSRQ